MRFDNHGDSTGAEVSLRVNTPGGTAGDIAAQLFTDPQRKVEDALTEFKKLIEAR